MNISEAKKILATGQSAPILILSPLHNSEYSGRACSIRSITGGWILLHFADKSISVRAASLETKPTAKLMGWVK